MSIIDKIGNEAKNELCEECLQVALAMRESKNGFYRFFAYALMEADYCMQLRIKREFESEWIVFLEGEDVGN